MDTFVKIITVCLLCAMLCVILRRYSPENALILSVLGCTAALAAALRLFAPILEFLQTLRSIAGLEPAAFSPLLKSVGIGALSQIAGAYCLDAGEKALAQTVELCGTILCALCALPLGNLVLEMLKKLMEG